MQFRHELIHRIDREQSNRSDSAFNTAFSFKKSHQRHLRNISARLYPPPDAWQVVNPGMAQNSQVIPECDMLLGNSPPDVRLIFEDSPIETDGTIENCRFIRRLKAQGVNFYQAPIYSFTSLPTIGISDRIPSIDVTCHLKTYYDYLITGEYIACELAEAILRRGLRGRDITNGEIDALREELPVRRMLHENPRWTYIKCGVVTPLAFKTPDGIYRLPLMKRSSRVSESQGLWQTIPAGSFQPEHPENAFHDDDFNLLNCALKETAEELFGYEPPAKLRQSSMNEIHYLPPIRAIRKLMQSSRAEFVVTGIGIESLTNRVDFTALLIVHDEGWFDEFGKQMKINEEGSELLLVEPRLDSLPKQITPATLSAMSELAILRAEKFLSL